jgi:tellurite resistance protein
MTWHPLGETVLVAGRAINGLVYTGKPKRDQDKHKFMINPSLRVGTAGHVSDRQAMPYWPDYADIDAQARSVYLNWLADGRRTRDADVGCVFLFFYGLEYRFFRDNPNANERAIILQEVKDLLEVYGENHSVQRYLGNFIEFASLQVPGAIKPEPVFDRHGWEVPIMVRLALGTYADSGKSITADWMLSWLVTHPEHRLRTPAKRCFDEFKTLFAGEFNRKFPDGYALRKPKKKLNLVYQAASGSFHHQLGGKIADLPDISSLTKPLEEMAGLAETVTERLEKYSRYLGRNPEGRGTLEAQALLPVELRNHFPSEELDALRSWVADKIESSGLVPAIDVIARLEGERPTKLTKSQLISAADSLARLGFGLAPDPRFALRAPKPGEPVVLFDLGESVEQLEDISEAYRRGLIQLALGAFVAHADGNFAAREKETLQAQAAQISGLSNQERKRLRANIDWFSAVPPDIALLRRRLSDADAAQSDSIRTAIVAIAFSDGMIRPEEVSGIEKIYKALGLDPALVYSDLHSGDGPVRVKQAEPIIPGEAIPQEMRAAVQN